MMKTMTFKYLHEAHCNKRNDKDAEIVAVPEMGLRLLAGWGPAGFAGPDRPPAAEGPSRLGVLLNLQGWLSQCLGSNCNDSC